MYVFSLAIPESQIWVQAAKERAHSRRTSARHLTILEICRGVKRNETKYIFEMPNECRAEDGGDRLRYSSPFFPSTLLPPVSRVPQPRLPSSSKTRPILFPLPFLLPQTEPVLFRASSGLPNRPLRSSSQRWEGGGETGGEQWKR